MNQFSEGTNMKKRAFNKSIGWVVACLLCSASSGWAKKNVDADLSFSVKDLKGRPVEGATVSVRFRYMSQNPYGRRSTYGTGTTDVKGAASLFGKTYGRIDYEVSGPEHYATKHQIYFKGTTRAESVLVRPKVNPIPMFALKSIHKLVPAQNTELGFDLMKADWMPPHGRGEVQDLTIKAAGNMGPITLEERKFWSTMAVTFAGKYDGLVPMPRRPLGAQSAMRSDYEAPKRGYKKTANFEHTQNMSKKTDYESADVSYIRIRSPQDSSASGGLYGKLYGNLVEMTEEGPCLTLSYLFINPAPGSRNVEFDMTQNLAPDYLSNVAAGAACFKVDQP